MNDMTKAEIQRMWAATRPAVTVDDAYARAYDVGRGGHILHVNTASAGYRDMCRLAAGMARLRFAAVDPLRERLISDAA